MSVDRLLQRDPAATVINAGAHQGPREIRGAIRYRPADLLEREHLALPIDREATVILYAEHGPTDELRAIAEKMSADGFTDVRVAEGTFADYERGGGAVQAASVEQAVPPNAPPY